MTGDLGQLKAIMQLAEQAGELIMRYYEGELSAVVTSKNDNSPVTTADVEANRLIYQGLVELTPGMPVLSEESALEPFEKRRCWASYWLVDPLDGTRGFIDREGDFTVNIARVDQGVATLGVVYVPDQKKCYAAAEGVGAFRADGDNVRLQAITARPHKESLTLSRSARRSSSEYAQMKGYLLDKGYEIDEKREGSSLKLCRIAEGVSDLYPCLVPTREWDTAAGQVVVEQAGGLVIDVTTGQRLKYNQKRSLLNPGFLAVADPAFDWPELIRSLSESGS